MVPSTEFWPLCHVAKDLFWEMANKLPMGASISLESTNEKDHHRYLTLFDDHPKGEGILISLDPS